MADAGFLEGFAPAQVAQPVVEAFGAALGVQHQFAVATGAGRTRQRGQQLPSFLKLSLAIQWKFQ